MVCDRVREEYEMGGDYEYHSDMPKYLALNGGVAVATFAGVFVLALLIPMLTFYVTHMVRRYWRRLNA
jgi:glycerol-3-phosphate acyltransferase PlsY